MAQVLEPQAKPPAGRRSAFEVRMDVLKVAAEGSVKPTRIMYRSNTSWVILQKNLGALLACGFITECGEDPRVEYSITDRGMGVLRDYVDLTRRTMADPGEARE